MSLWRRVRRALTGPRDADAEADADADATQERKGGAGRPEAVDSAASAPVAAHAAGAPLDEVDRLARAGEADGPSVAEALGILRRLRGSVREADAISAVLRASGARSLDEELRLACADLLAARGDERQALDLLEGATSTAALVLAADLYSSSGQLARAVGTIERVLARQIDAPGARERHVRWRAALGPAAGPVRRLDEATIVAPTGSRTPFRLLREVARGGAGAVYEAEDEQLGRRVAFKVYHRRGDDRALVEREARMTVAFAGPGVVRVFDASPDDGWVALEWVARGSIRDVLRSGDAAAMCPVERWARPLARALARIHSAGLVHADLKPGNVLLRAPADPVLADFGITRPRGAPSEGGSPGYVSPERLAGKALDPRDDVYAFGRVLEDVLQRLASGQTAAPAGDLGPWQAVAVACLGPAEGRPADGAELARQLP